MSDQRRQYRCHTAGLQCVSLRTTAGRRRLPGRILRVLAACLLAASGVAMSEGDDEFAAARQGMLAAIETSVRESASYTGRDHLHERVMKAMGSVPREAFVPTAQRHLAYRNTPLPIAAGQTISQPLIVALMTDLLDPQQDDTILEVGTGSGYQAAVLSGLVRHVYSIEIIPELAAEASETLSDLGYGNVTVRAGDGYAGWPEHAPFDSIIVTAAAPEIPPPLLQQLKPGGKLVIPVGEVNGYQELLVLETAADGSVQRRSVLPVRFVPLTGDR